MLGRTELITRRAVMRAICPKRAALKASALLRDTDSIKAIPYSEVMCVMSLQGIL